MEKLIAGQARALGYAAAAFFLGKTTGSSIVANAVMSHTKTVAANHDPNPVTRTETPGITRIMGLIVGRDGSTPVPLDYETPVDAPPHR